MKKLFTLCSLLIFTISSCSSDGEMGPRGPQGPPGEPGEDGTAATIFEASVTFTEDNNYTAFVGIPETIEIYDSDLVLVYLLERVDEETGADVWSLLPQTFYLDEGQLVYNYTHTSFDVELFLHGTVDLSTLGEAYTDDQIFRIAVVPAGSLDESAVDVSSYHAVQKALNVGPKEIPTVEIKK